MPYISYRLKKPNLPATVMYTDQANTLSNVSEPSTPATGKGAVWFDASLKKWRIKYDNGTIENLGVGSSGAVAHKDSHKSGGSDAFAKTDVLNTASRYLETKSDPSSDASALWLVDGGLDIKYWDDQGTPVKQTLERRSMKGVANGYCELDEDGFVPPERLSFDETNIAMRDYTARVFKIDSTYYALKFDGTLIDSGAVFETVAQSAIALHGAIYFGGIDFFNDQEFEITSAGLVVTDNIYGTHLIFGKQSGLVVPNGFTGTAVHFLNSAYSGLTLDGYIMEAGTPARLWTGVKFEASANGESCVYSTLDGNSGIIDGALNCVQLHAVGTGFTQAIEVKDITFFNFINGVVWSGNGPRGGNVFNNLIIQCPPYALRGFKDVSNGGDNTSNTITNCVVWDLPGGAQGINILSDGKVTILGGKTMYDPANDLSSETTIFDERFGTLTHEPIRITKTGSSFIELYRPENTVDSFHTIQFMMNDSAGNKTIYASEFAYLEDNTNGSEEGAWGVNCMVGGSENNLLYMNGADGLSFTQTGSNYASLGTANLSEDRAYQLPDVDTMLAGLGVAQTFTQNQTISENTINLLDFFRPVNTVDAEWGIDFNANDSTSVKTKYASINAYIVDNTNATEDGGIEMSTIVNGAEQFLLFIEPSGFYISQTGGNYIVLSNSGISGGDKTFTFPNANSLLIGNDNTDVTLADGKDFAVGSSAGTKIGTATTQKIGFFNATPIAQKAANADTSGATLGQLETEVNELKQIFRDFGWLAT